MLSPACSCRCLRITQFAVQHLSDDASVALSNPPPILLLELWSDFPRLHSETLTGAITCSQGLLWVCFFL